MSLEVWCYECDEYVEGWDLLDQMRTKFEDSELDLEIIIDNTETRGFKSKKSGAGNKIGYSESVNFNHLLSGPIQFRKFLFHKFGFTNFIALSFSDRLLS